MRAAYAEPGLRRYFRAIAAELFNIAAAATDARF